MKNSIINTQKINTVNYLSGNSKGIFRSITKCRAGFMSIVDARGFENERMLAHPEEAINGYKKGSLQTVEFKADDNDFFLTVFARKGKTIVTIDEAILAGTTVGTVNQMYDNTNLYSQDQYNAVNAKTWADKAFVMNSHPVETINFLNINL